MKIEVFFDDVITGQDDVITFRFSLAFKISGWTIAENKNFWIWTIRIVSRISQRTPTFQISSSKKCYKSMQNPSTKPCFRVSRLLWIRWWGQIWPIQTYNDTHFIYVSRHYSASLLLQHKKDLSSLNGFWLLTDIILIWPLTFRKRASERLFS